jgi:flagellin
MPIVINTNVQALQNANNLNASATNLTKSLSRLSSGSRIVVPSDDAAGLAVSSRLQSQIARLDAALSNVINAVSFTQTQDGFLKTIDKAFRRMGELAMLAQDQTKSTDDRALYDQEFGQLQDYITATSLQKFNAVTLFSSTTLPVTIDSSGNTFGLTGTDLTAASYANATDSSVSIATTSAATEAMTKVLEAIGQVAIDRARLGALQARLNFTSEQLLVTKENLTSAVSRISDVDVAEEATVFARNQILVQSGTVMLQQANTLPQAALRLLQP